uniref:F-box domain-containing protein n=1 Tax=Caenorhabditis japonica TaxID=281687 RepID=A0A8R1HZ02_CAEJA
MKPRAVLDDMPLHIKEHIVKSVDYETRFSLRKCSKSMCQIVDKSPIHYTTIILHIDKFVAFLTFSHPQKKSDYKIKVDYRKSIDHRKVQVTKWKDEPVKSTLVHGVEFPHLVAQDVWNALKNPNLKVNNFRVVVTPRTPYTLMKKIVNFQKCRLIISEKEIRQIFEILRGKLNSLNHKLHIKILTSTFPDNFKNLNSVLCHVARERLTQLRILDASQCVDCQLWSNFNILLTGTFKTFSLADAKRMISSIYHSNQTHELEIRIDDLNFEKVKLFEILGPSRLEHRNLYNTRIFTRGNLKNDMVIQYSEKSLKVNTNSMLKDRRQCYDTFPEELIFKLLCRS